MENKQHQIQYNGENISYEIIPSRIKNMYIYIKEGKVIVKAPIRLKEEHIHEFVNRKAKWIDKNLKREKENTKIEEPIKLEELKRLERIVKNNIEKYGRQLKEIPNKVRIRDIKYAWGSCSSNRNITINQKLAKKDDKIIEYVVLHEMCHLKYMNHSKAFWSLIETYLPNYKEYRKKLKQ